MKRLWIRLSTAFSVVVLFSMMVLVGMPVLLFRLGVLDQPIPPRISTEDRQAEDQDFDDFTTEQVLRRLSQVFLWVAVVGGTLGVAAGIRMSRGLTAPLDELAAAARAVGARDLSQRVAVRGSQEVMDVGAAFNQMALDLEQAEQLRRNLLSDVAHELRTPLTVLQGNLRAILDDVYAMDKEEVARLYDQTRHLSRLVEDLHELAQAEARQLPLDLQETDITSRLRSVAAIFEPVAQESGVRLVTAIPDALPPVWVDGDRITQVLHNLLSNALRHTPKGGTITLSASVARNQIRIAVEDTGEGIAPQHLDRVFDRFYRTDQSRVRDTGGTGLGLAITKALVETHNGRVTVASGGLGGGTEFRIYLPLLPA